MKKLTSLIILKRYKQFWLVYFLLSTNLYNISYSPLLSYDKITKILQSSIADSLDAEVITFFMPVEEKE
jgi:hypothetical protein